MDLSSGLFEFLGSSAVYVGAFIFVLTIVVFFHELGHFMAARACGVAIEVFSIGFGPRVASWTDRHGTEWRVSLLPLGGYVKFLGDENAASMPDRKKLEGEDGGRPLTTQFPAAADAHTSGLTPEQRASCFHFKPLWQRAIVVAAGPVANFVLAAIIFAGLLVSFGERVIDPRVGQVLADSAAQEAGLRPGDLIVEVQGRRIERFKDLQEIIVFSSDTPLRMVVVRNGEQIELTATPRRMEHTDWLGNTQRYGTLGITSTGAEEDSRYVRYGPGEAALAGVQRVQRIIGQTLKFLGRLITGNEDPKELGGPLRIAQYSGQTAAAAFDGQDSFADGLRASVINLIQLAGFLSVSVGLINLFPIPMLDGGHLLYYGYEAVAGRPLGERAQEIGFRIGLALVLSMMAFATWNDLNNLWSQ